MLNNYELKLSLRLMVQRSIKIRERNNLVTFKAPAYKLISFFTWDENMYDKFWLRSLCGT